MYSYVDSVYLGLTFGSKWERDSLTNLHLDQISMKNLFKDFQHVYLVLEHPANPDPIYADLEQFRLFQSTSDLTLQEFLTNLEGLAVSEIESLPSIETKEARYLNALQGSYRIDRCRIGFPTPVNYPTSDLPDLKLTRPDMDTDMSLLHTHGLMSVNGFYHRTDTDNNEAYIRDGAKTLLKTYENHVGLFSFLDLCAVEQVPIQEHQIFSPIDGDPLRTRININLERNLENKTVLMVLGGYLVLPEDQVFWQTGDSIFTLDLNRLPYIERLFESNAFIDLSEMNIPHPSSQMGDDVALIDELWSDEKIIKYLTLSQTFMVVLDIPRIEVDRTFVRSSGVAGALTTYQKPQLPLIMGHGRQVEYWRREERPYWSIMVKDPLYRNYILTQKLHESVQVINNHLDNVEPFQFGRGFLLRISGQPNN